MKPNPKRVKVGNSVPRGDALRVLCHSWVGLGADKNRFSPRRQFAIRSADIEADRLHVRARGCYFGVLFVSAISDVSVFRPDDLSLQGHNLDVAFKVERKGSFVNEKLFAVHYFKMASSAAGVNSLNPGARMPIYQYASGAVDNTLGVGAEVALPVGSSRSRNIEVVPKIFESGIPRESQSLWPGPTARRSWI